MNNSNFGICLMASALSLLFPLLCVAESAPDKFDVVVVSGSSGGFSAALAAGRMGAKIALIEDTPVLGGMLANGISNSDTFSYESLSGIFEEFRLKVKEYYSPIMSKNPIFQAPDWPVNHIDGRSQQSAHPKNGGTWEPHVADEILKKMIAAVPNVRVLYNTYATNVVMQGNRIVGVVTRDKKGQEKTFYGDVIIDATHEGDIAAWAGVPYRVGREARSELEPHAGEIYYLDETGEIMPGSTGRQDRAVVSYGLRLTVKVYSEKDGQAPLLVEPPEYRKEDYVYAGCITKPWVSMANDKFEMNANPIGNELQEINWIWPEATHEERRRLYEKYKNHALGFLYYQQHECHQTQLGLPKDEFVGNGYVPYRVFVREARRIEGEAMMTEADINPFLNGEGLIPPLKIDSISIGHYALDAKPVLPKTDFSRPDKGNGNFFLVNAAHAYQVPYGAIVPKRVDGMLVPVAMSATHVAFSAVRMDPSWVAMGQAAGVAAVLSLRDKTTVRDLSVSKLQRELLRQKVRLMFYWDVPLEHPAFAAVQWLSVKNVVSGDSKREFHPDQPLSRGNLANWLVRALRISPSVSNVHFEDVPYDHAAFRDIETLFDHGLLAAFAVQPMWPKLGGFNAERNLGFLQKHGIFGKFEPERAVTWQELIDMLQKWETDLLYSPGGDVHVSNRPATALDWIKQCLSASEFGRSSRNIDVHLEKPVTRGQAAMVIAAWMEGRN